MLAHLVTTTSNKANIGIIKIFIIFLLQHILCNWFHSCDIRFFIWSMVDGNVAMYNNVYTLAFTYLQKEKIYGIRSDDLIQRLGNDSFRGPLIDVCHNFKITNERYIAIGCYHWCSYNKHLWFLLYHLV